MNKKKNKDADRSFGNKYQSLWPNENPVGFKFEMETDANSGNLSVPEHMILKTHSSGQTFSTLLIFIFFGMLDSPLIKSQPFVAMEPN